MVLGQAAWQDSHVLADNPQSFKKCHERWQGGHNDQAVKHFTTIMYTMRQTRFFALLFLLLCSCCFARTALKAESGGVRVRSYGASA